MRSQSGTRLRFAGKLTTAVLAACLAILPGAAPAHAAPTGGAPTPVGSPPAPPSPIGSPAADAPSAGALSLTSATASPRKTFFYGVRYPSLTFSIASTQAQNDLRIDLLDSAGQVVRTFYRNDVAPDTTTAIRWDGTTLDGRPAASGRYSFRIGAQGAATIAARATHSLPPLNLSFELYGYAFPLLGPHDFGGPEGRFGAARAGHTHQGQDVMAGCGQTIVAARGGSVQYAGFESAAGNYIVIDGKGTGYDMAYMHLLEPSPLRTDDPVRTGQPVGLVGDTGDALACHLHFEIWTSPGWYEGGSPIDPLPFLKQWDAYS